MVTSKFVTYCPEIPPLPQDLQNDIVKIVMENENQFVFNSPTYKNFGVFEVNERIIEWCKEHFKWNHRSSIRTIDNSLPVHIDMDNTVAYNFVLETGGEDVHTSWYESLAPNAKKIEDHVFPKGKWVRILTDSPHGVTNIEQGKKRILLAVLNITPINREAYRHQKRITCV